MSKQGLSDKGDVVEGTAATVVFGCYGGVFGIIACNFSLEWL